MISSYSYDVEFSNQLCLYVKANKHAEHIVFIPVFFYSQVLLPHKFKLQIKLHWALLLSSIQIYSYIDPNDYKVSWRESFFFSVEPDTTEWQAGREYTWKTDLIGQRGPLKMWRQHWVQPAWREQLTVHKGTMIWLHYK